ncbi:MAG: acetoacetate--CoA ligase [Motiliproteus sp.]
MIKEGDLLWTPSPEWIEKTNFTAFMTWLNREQGFSFTNYDELYRWSVDDIEAFWSAIWEYFSIESESYDLVLGSREMPGAEWFPASRLNYAQHVLRREHQGGDALMFLNESGALQSLSWIDLANQVRIIASQLRELGVQPGDRVVAYMPNIPETLIAMLATTSIGAIWASCSPEYGAPAALDRISQLSPKVLFCVDGYRYGGKSFDRRDQLAEIIGGLKELEQVVYLPYLDTAATPPACTALLHWNELMDHPPVSAEQFDFEQVHFDHPLWILFSSGTTGSPKAIMHGHGGILLEMNKLLHLHMDFHPGERVFFYTTTGWMMWNFLASALLTGACPVLYDGDPSYPTPDVLWKMAQDTGASFFGASPTYVEIMSKHGIVPGEKYDLSNLRAIMPAGSPVSPECTAWFYENVKQDLWVATGSGGTDCCTGFVGGVPILPVYAGEMQASALGVDAQAWSDDRESLIDEVGELMITQPLPSMPVGFWNDDDNRRYKESYFEEFPGVWRHGDFFRLNTRGGCFVLGRSDATLNRYGVRIGTAEIYRALAAVPSVTDSLIVNLDLPEGKFFMPLFVQLADGRKLNPETEAAIRSALRKQCSPRHVPDRIIQVAAVPRTLTGKIMEVPVRKVLMGMPLEKAANKNVMANPEALEAIKEYAQHQSDYPIT